MRRAGLKNDTWTKSDRAWKQCNWINGGITEAARSNADTNQNNKRLAADYKSHEQQAQKKIAEAFTSYRYNKPN